MTIDTTVQERPAAHDRDPVYERDLRFAWDRIRTLFYDDNRRGEISAALGLSWVKIKALRRLKSGPMTMRELAQALVTDKPYITQIVDALEARGLVTRSVDENDRRCRIATLTAQGREAARRSEEILARPPEALAGLSERDLSELARIMARMPAGQGDGEPG